METKESKKWYQNGVQGFLKILIRDHSFFLFHFSYFVLVCLIGGLIIWGIEYNNLHISFIDALYMATSAMTVTGLIVVDFSLFHLASKIIILFLILMGGTCLLSVVPPFIRLFYLRNRSKERGEVSLHIRVCLIIIITVLMYWFLVQLTSFLVIGFYLQFSETGQNVLKVAIPENINPWWWALFHSVSSFNNAGFSLFQLNLIPFVVDPCVLIMLGLNLIAGNTLFPVFFYLIIFLLSKILRNENQRAIQLFLKEPRLFYTHLFPIKETLVILFGWIIITGLEFFLYFVEWDKTLGGYNAGEKILIMLFQTVSVRTAGFNIVDLSLFSTAHLALFVLTMYISAYPFIVSIRSSAVNEDNDLKKEAKNVVSRDLIWLYAALLIICYVEADRPSFELVPSNYLRTVFEVSSAFGTVGLSVGYPGAIYSFSGSFYGVSKFIMILVMLFGRHRGLPSSIDPSVSVSQTDSNKEKSISKSIII